MNQEFRLKNIDERRNYLIEEINQNEAMSIKYKKVYRVLNYIDYINFYSYWMRFHFCFCFFSWYSFSNYDLWNRIRNLYNNCRNQKV